MQPKTRSTEQIARGIFQLAETRLEIEFASHVWLATDGAGNAGSRMTHHQHIGIGLHVRDHRRAPVRRGIEALDCDPHQRVDIGPAPRSRIGKTGIGQRDRRIGGHVGEAQIVECGNKSAPVAAMNDIAVQELQRKACVLDLAVGPGHFPVDARHIDIHAQHCRHDEQSERKRNHQLEQAEAAIQAGATGAHAFHSAATPTSVVSARRHRSPWHGVPGAPS